jgi:dihydrofolate reductase
MQRSNRKRKFIVYVATSADGFIARRDGAVDWLERPRPKGNYGMGAFYRSIYTCVLGRKTYDVSVKFGMADGYAGKKNYVFSRKVSKAASPKVGVVSGDVHIFSERLRSEKGKDIWLVGGAELVAAFLDSGQVDEFIIHPSDPDDDRRGDSAGCATPSRCAFETTDDQKVPRWSRQTALCRSRERKHQLTGC